MCVWLRSWRRGAARKRLRSPSGTRLHQAQAVVSGSKMAVVVRRSIRLTGTTKKRLHKKKTAQQKDCNNKKTATTPLLLLDLIATGLLQRGSEKGVDLQRGCSGPVEGHRLNSKIRISEELRKAFVRE